MDQIVSRTSNSRKHPFTAYLAKLLYILISNQPIMPVFPYLFENGQLIPFENFKTSHNLLNKDFFSWRQIVAAIPRAWKTILRSSTCGPDLCKTQGIFFITRHLCLQKLSSKQIYQILVYKTSNPPTSQAKIQQILNNSTLLWADIYLYGRKITLDSFSRFFHFKCAHNILYLNDRLFKMKLANTSACSLCGLSPETMVHLFSECPRTNELWAKLAEKLNIVLPPLTPESAYCGFYKSKNILHGHIHLIFKMLISKHRQSGTPSENLFLNKIKQIRQIEKTITSSSVHAKRKNTIKWSSLEF